MIIKFEQWYQEEFDIPMAAVGVNQPIDTDLQEPERNLFSQGHDSSKASNHGILLDQEEVIEDEDAATYRRAK